MIVAIDYNMVVKKISNPLFMKLIEYSSKKKGELDYYGNEYVADTNTYYYKGLGYEAKCVIRIYPNLDGAIKKKIVMLTFVVMGRPLIIFPIL